MSNPRGSDVRNILITYKDMEETKLGKNEGVKRLPIYRKSRYSFVYGVSVSECVSKSRDKRITNSVRWGLVIVTFLLTELPCPIPSFVCLCFLLRSHSS